MSKTEQRNDANYMRQRNENIQEQQQNIQMLVRRICKGWKSVRSYAYYQSVSLIAKRLIIYFKACSISEPPRGLSAVPLTPILAKNNT